MDNLTVEQRKKNMSNIRSTNTEPERLVFKELRKRKVYFTKNAKDIMGRPDIVFKRKRIAVFIDSDFWHGHPKRFQMPKTNTEYWKKKISDNKERDKRVTRSLREKDWRVIRIWEHEIRSDLESCIARILNEVSKSPVA